MKDKLTNLIMKLNKKTIFFWIFGFLAFLWVVLRSGTNPKRLAYPCQKAAYPIAASWILGIVGITTGTVLLKKVFKFSIPVIIILISSWLFISNSKGFKQAKVGNYPEWKSANAISEVFVFDNIPPTSGSLAAGDASVPDNHLPDPGVDSLVAIMESSNQPFFKTTKNTNGIVGKNDVVIIKTNFQWRHRLGTNTDRIKGVIWQILNHPESFTGEILVCDNQESQIWPKKWLAGFNDNSNNSDDTDQSIVDVINTFKNKGYPVDYYVWDSLNPYTVSEYNTGDMNNGYIFNSTSLVSYPKFQTPAGSYVSLAKGIWNSSGETYSKDNLTIINMPVLKRHGMVGATIALKNWIGVMNTTKHDEWFGGWVDDTFHPLYCFSEYALVARQLDVVWPDLNIVDATWMGTINNYDYNHNAVNGNTILASTDPVAVSWYAAKYVLQPVVSSSSKVDPDNNSGSTSNYGTVLHRWYSYLNDSTLRSVTKDPTLISVITTLNSGDDSSDNGVNNQNASIEVYTYPNPSFDAFFTVQVENTTEVIAAKVFNMKGQVITTINLNEGENTIDLTSYPSGVYYLMYNSNSKSKYIKLLSTKQNILANR